MMICYKITDANLRTHGGFQYVQGVRAEVKPFTGELCSSGVLHAYATPEDAVFFDPIHARLFATPGARLWRCEYDGPEVSDGTKLGVGNLTLLEEIPVPTMTIEQRVERCIKAALGVYTGAAFSAWAEKWLSGEDRSESAAYAAADAARAAADAAAKVAADAARVARAAADAAAADAAWATARAAADAARAVADAAADAAWATAWATARAAADAAWATARAAADAARAAADAAAWAAWAVAYAAAEGFRVKS